MKRFMRTAAARTFAAVMAMLLLGALLSLVLRGGGSPITSAVGLVTGPLQGISARLAGYVKGVAGNFTSSAHLRELLESRDAEIARLRDGLVDYDETKNKLAQLTELLDMKLENPDLRFVDTAVIHTERLGEGVTELTLNRGGAKGIRVNHPVLAGPYLVGIVVETTLTTCTVRTILNPKVFVTVSATNTREVGVARSTPELAREGMCAIPELERNTTFSAGNLIYTSGTGEIYPKGLILGTITEVAQGDQNFYVTAVVQPAVDFNALSDVVVLIEQ